MKKLLFSANDMNIGGIETALLTLLNYLSDKKYDITLVLEKKQGKFLNDLNSNINVIEYNPSENRIFFIRKIVRLVLKISKVQYKWQVIMPFSFLFLVLMITV